MHLLFITSLNFASNPRLVKEVRLALSKGFSIEVICFEFRNWSYDLNRQIKNNLQNEGVHIHFIEAGRRPFFKWLLSVLVEKSARFLSRLFPANRGMLAFAVSRRTLLLIEALDGLKEKPKLVIGHNPAALLPVYIAGRRFCCKTGFDVEDYHPGEGHDKRLQLTTKNLMKNTLPFFNYVTFSSPLIQKKVEEDFFAKPANWNTINNYFFSSEFAFPERTEGPLKLVWFSQYIAQGRGLEMVLAVVAKYQTDLELHLFGHLDDEFRQKNAFPANVHIHEPVSQVALHKQLSFFDAGFATEPGKDINNQLAVSNKILAYIQAGLYVLATDTYAQRYLLEEKKWIGEVVKDSSQMERALQNLILEKNELRSNKPTRFELGRSMSWEAESEILLRQWKEVLGENLTNTENNGSC